MRYFHNEEHYKITRKGNNPPILPKELHNGKTSIKASMLRAKVKNITELSPMFLYYKQSAMRYFDSE